MTHLRQRMLEELQRRNYSPRTVRSHVHAVEAFASYLHRAPDQLGPDHIRAYQAHLFRDCKLSPRTIGGQTAALRFLFVRTLGRACTAEQIPFPKVPQASAHGAQSAGGRSVDRKMQQQEDGTSTQAQACERACQGAASYC